MSRLGLAEARARTGVRANEAGEVTVFGSLGLPELVIIAAMLLCPLVVVAGVVVLIVWLQRRPKAKAPEGGGPDRPGPSVT